PPRSPSARRNACSCGSSCPGSRGTNRSARSTPLTSGWLSFSHPRSCAACRRCSSWKVATPARRPRGAQPRPCRTTRRSSASCASSTRASSKSASRARRARTRCAISRSRRRSSAAISNAGPSSPPRGTRKLRIGLFTDALPELSLERVLDWLAAELPLVRDVEIGTGGYSPAQHCDRELLLADADPRAAWLETIESRDFRLAALNVSGNPLEVPEHDRALRETIALASLLRVARVVCMPGGRPAHGGGAWT